MTVGEGEKPPSVGSGGGSCVRGLVRGVRCYEAGEGPWLQGGGCTRGWVEVLRCFVLVLCAYRGRVSPIHPDDCACLAVPRRTCPGAGGERVQPPVIDGVTRQRPTEFLGTTASGRDRSASAPSTWSPKNRLGTSARGTSPFIPLHQNEPVGAAAVARVLLREAFERIPPRDTDEGPQPYAVEAVAACTPADGPARCPAAVTAPAGPAGGSTGLHVPQHMITHDRDPLRNGLWGSLSVPLP